MKSLDFEKKTILMPKADHQYILMACAEDTKILLL